ncbi:ribosome hibernation factor-recruiting GTPase MRF [Lolliginicoccus lacisalsi]|uniref:ribosome hibernation factor-recruiting GTPase MRF n=1 Tax=Lolliginicoccus lacisalsi TaxID=2742202 RepID=UPI0038CC13F8
MLVCGWQEDASPIARAFQREGTSIVHYDLAEVKTGVICRALTTTDGVTPRMRTTLLAAAPGRASDAIREDLLPLLRRLASRSRVERIVLLVPPMIDIEDLRGSISTAAITGMVGHRDGPLRQDVRIHAVISALDSATWFADATSAEALAGRGLAGTPPEATVASAVTAWARAADGIVVLGASHGDPELDEAPRLAAVLDRLAPGVPIAWQGSDLVPDPHDLLALLPAEASSPATPGIHDPLLGAQPPLESEHGIQWLEFGATRPFHPQRLHEALDPILDGTIHARGRAWLATAPGTMLWLESSGGGLTISAADRWLAAMTPAEHDEQPAERTAMAAARWTPEHGDRHTALVLLVHDGQPERVRDALAAALVTESELAAGHELWRTWEDPFGAWHQDPCAGFPGTGATTGAIDIDTRKEGD